MKKAIWVIAVLIFLVWTGCTESINEKEPPPPDLIPRDTMVSIFVDLSLMDAVLIYDQKTNNRKVYDVKYYLHNSIMEKYGITRDQFERSFDYYEKDMKTLNGIYADAITRLSKMKSKTEHK